jgi:hypothetical protein
MNWWAGFLCYTFCFFIFCFIEMGPTSENPDESLLPETVDTRFLCHSFCCDGIGRTPSSFLRPTLFFHVFEYYYHYSYLHILPFQTSSLAPPAITTYLSAVANLVHYAFYIVPMFPLAF